MKKSAEKTPSALSRLLADEKGMVNMSNLFSLIKILFWVGAVALVFYCLYNFFVVGLFGDKKEKDIPQTGIPAIDQPLHKE